MISAERRFSWLNNIWVLLAAGLLAHLWLIQIGLHGIGTPMGDVPYAYQPWLLQMINSHKLLGINMDWVYPFPALLPIWTAALINPMDFQTGWFTLVIIVDLVALAALANWGRRNEDTAMRFSAAWYWLCFVIALGPVSISRIDAFSVALALFGVLQLAKRKLNSSTAWFSIGAAMKVWPAAILLAIMSASKYRIRVLVAMLSTGAILLGLGFLLGGNSSMFSFLNDESERGIQIESPIASWWIWAGKFRLANSGIYYDKHMLTFQVAGDGIPLISSLMTYAMLVAIAITCWLTWRAAKSGTRFQQLLPIAALTAVLDLIVFNKVGSPQFVTWLAVPIIIGVLYRTPNWKLPMISVIAIALVTDIVYPVVYDYILNAQTWALAILLLRNLGYIALLIWANRRLAGEKLSQ